MSASGKADEEGRKVFLGGLSFDVSDRDLRTDFAKYGDIEDLQLPMGDGGKHKGFAFITYRDPKDADYACKEHHQRSYQGREISAKIVVPRGERGGGGGERGGGCGSGGDNFRPGDWECPSCGANVFGSKSACFKCGEPKPSGGGGGRGDYGRRRDDRDDSRGGGGGRYRDRSYSPDRRRDDRDYDRGRDRRDDYDRRDRRDDYDRRDRRDDRY